MLFILDPSPSPASTTGSKLASVLFADPASTAHTSVFSLLWPRRVAYQHIRFLHALFVLCSFALSNVAPVLFPQPSAELAEKVIISQAQHILQMANQISAEGVFGTASPLRSDHGG